MTIKAPFLLLSNLLPKTDPRYLKWKSSLKNRPAPWNKGKTKDTDPNVKKISETFLKKKIDNFSAWRIKLIQSGDIVTSYSPLPHSVKLAILIGLVLGDGNIHEFPRTDKLTITLGLDKLELIEFTRSLVFFIFEKKPAVLKYSTAKAVRITLYQKQISERMGIPTGNRKHSTTGIPEWVWRSNEYLVGCLKGLFEAEASLCVHLPTSTHNFSFHNKNKTLLQNVSRALKILGLNPEIRPYAIRLRKKDEVKYFEKLIQFRSYCGIC